MQLYLKLEQYLKITQLNEDYKDDTLKLEREIVAHLTGNSLAEVDKLPILKFRSILRSINPPENRVVLQLPQEIKLDGRLFKLECDPKNWSAGKFIDISEALKNPKDVFGFLCLLFVPRKRHFFMKRWAKYGEYMHLDVKQTLIKHLDAQVGLDIVNFFLTRSIYSLKISQAYLKETKKKARKKLLQTLLLNISLGSLQLSE